MNSLFSMIRGVCFLGFVSITLAACSGAGADDGSDGSSSSGAATSSAGTSSAGTSSSSGGSTGTTTCGAQQCEAGQHCENLLCVNGCLTDSNCASNQTCQDINADTSIGTCKNNATTPTKDCNALCEKAQACQDPNAAQCMQLCTAASAECVQCLINSNCGEGCDGVC